MTAHERENNHRARYQGKHNYGHPLDEIDIFHIAPALTSPSYQQ
jgi:hypothetical protein